VLDKHLHTFDGIHVSTGIHIYRTGPFLRERVNANVRLSKRVHNRNTLRMKLMRESVEHSGSAHFDGTFECRFDACEIIQKME
jgi:hypothetical protein